MGKSDNSGLYAAFVLVMTFGLGGLIGYAIGEHEGQMDVVTGAVRYERVMHPDSTVTWEQVAP